VEEIEGGIRPRRRRYVGSRAQRRGPRIALDPVDIEGRNRAWAGHVGSDQGRFQKSGKDGKGKGIQIREHYASREKKLGGRLGQP